VLQKRIDTLLMLEEQREKAKQKFVAHQRIVKHWFDKHKVGNKDFDVGDLVLKWDKANEPKGKHSKFQNLWLGPYQIVEKIGVGTYHLQSMGENWILSLNGQTLKHFFT
jgi:hypothetical protein